MSRYLFAVDSAAAAAIALVASLAIVATAWSPSMAETASPAKPVEAKPTESKAPAAAQPAPDAAAPSRQAEPQVAPPYPKPGAAAVQPPVRDAAEQAPAAAAQAPARDAAAEAIWKEYEKRWSQTATYVAGFRQTIEVPDVGTKVESAGRFYFQKPDKVQWQYTEGPPQTVVGDGEFLWVYQPDLEQVYKIPYGKAFGRGGLVALLAGRQGASERYQVTLQNTGEGSVKIRLTPLDKSEGDLEVTLAADTFDLRGVIVHDPAGSMTNMVFSEPVRNKGLDASLFAFTPPQGVDIVTDHEAAF